MVTSRTFRVLIVVVALGSWGSVLAGELLPVERRTWKPVADRVYLQESGRKVPSDKPVQSVAVHDAAGYAVVSGEVFLIAESSLKPIASAPTRVRSLQTHDGALWALTDGGLFRLRDGAWKKMDDRIYVDLCVHNGTLHGAAGDDVYRLEGGRFESVEPEGGYLSSNTTFLLADGTQVLMSPVRFGPVDRIASYSGTLYALRPGELVLFDGRIIDQDVVDWGMLPSPRTRDMLSFGSRLLITTDRGLGVLRGMAMTTLKGADGLPYEDTTCLAAGFADDVWIGTTKGAVRMLEEGWHYFGADHWLPGDHVHEVAVGRGVVYIATDRGIGIIRYEPYTLRKKADYYERHLDEWGHKRLGFIQMLYWGGDDKGWIREVSDNDGGHTAPYLAAMSFKYAVTGDEKDRAAALDAFKAMIWLDAVTPKDGFIARAIWSKVGDLDRRSTGGSGGLPAKWYPTDDGLWFWKGDTSSDEVDAHFYSVSIFHELAAKGVEKERAKRHLARIATHIIDNGWVLRDMNGKPTRWGRWDPDYLLRPYGMVARGLNGMQAQTYMLTAHAMTGEPRFEAGFRQLLEWGYHNYTVRTRITFPPEDIAPWDDELAFFCYYTLLRYAKDPTMRSFYLRSLERSWEVKRMEHVAWFNFAYSAITGNDGEVAKAVRNLREWPLDCLEHNYRNSHRHDLATEPGYVAYGVGTRGMSPRETSVKRGSQNALPYDGGAGGRRVVEPTGFLNDYWMGRYHGIIKAPETTDPKLLGVARRPRRSFGAPPYKGPDRPGDLLDVK